MGGYLRATTFVISYLLETTFIKLCETTLLTDCHYETTLMVDYTL